MAEETRSGLPLRDVLLLLLVAALWGFNFVPIRWALDSFPPFALAALRFIIAAIPIVFFVKRPPVPLQFVVGYGLAIGVGQFGLLFLAISLGMAAGVASLLIQVQVFFTIGLAAVWLNDRVQLHQLAGACLAGLGIVALVAERDAEGAQTSLIGLLLILLSAASWGTGNVVAKVAARRAPVDMFSLVVWSSLASPVPLAAMSFAFEGGTAVVDAILSASVRAWFSLAFIAYGATLFGFAAWNRMLHKHPTGSVAPFALLVPVAGLASAALLLGEPLSPIELVAAGIILTGLGLAVFGGRRRQMLAHTVRPP